MLIFVVEFTLLGVGSSNIVPQTPTLQDRFQGFPRCDSNATQPSFIVAIYALLLFGELLLLALAIAFAIRNHYHKDIGSLGSMMLRDGIVYYIALSGVTVANIIAEYNFPSGSQGSATLLQRVMHVILSNRLLLNMGDRLSRHSTPVTDTTGSYAFARPRDAGSTINVWPSAINSQYS
ncbi:hypothetical protein FA15DRAFT_221478 [Coprinopsis marcescibilis]|uniref:Uncharacterized protein n=1 Tax=Coprinopsis marcescibilis TaxID=230819 RepID=A0A5C3KGW5_COPMA|nr:hypothetical protein FA15DRAFT_221478 [Coprinopsis marcescibilis]